MKPLHWLVAGVFLVACGGAQSKAQNAPFRAHPPKEERGTPESAAPAPETWKLENGVDVYYLKRTDVPLFAVGVAIPGAGYDEEGMSLLVAEALNAGTTVPGLGSVNGPRVDGQSLSFELTLSGSITSLTVLPAEQEWAVKVLAAYVLSPEFRPEELDACRARAMDKALQGEAVSPLLKYGAQGLSDRYRSVSRDALVEYHRKVFVPEGAAVVMTGALPREEAERLSRTYFAGWRAPEPVPEAPPPPEKPPARRGAKHKALAKEPASSKTAAAAEKQVVNEAPTPPSETKEKPPILVNLADPIAPVVNVTLMGPPPSDPDYPAFRIVAELLQDRMMEVLRVEHQSTYTPTMSFGSTRSGSAISLIAKVRLDDVIPTIHDLRALIDELSGAPPSKERIASVVERQALKRVGQFGTVDGSVTVLSYAHLAKLGTLAEQVTKMRAVSPEDVRKVASARFKPENTYISVTGKVESLVSNLQELGPCRVR